MGFSKETDDALTQLWGRKISTLDIGRELARHPDAIRRRATALGLPSRRPLTGHWTMEREAVVRHMWEAGKSAGMIAKELGITRNAVIGKKSRLKLKNRRSTNTLSRANRKPQKPNYLIKSTRPELRVEPQIIPDVIQSDLGKTGISIFELNDLTCHSVLPARIDNMPRYCGEKCDPGKTFCPSHHAIYYRPGRIA